MSLTKFALFTAILGTALLLFLSQGIEPKLVKISEIDENMLEQNVKVQGTVISIKQYESIIVFDLQDESGQIPVVAYAMENLSGNAEVIGRVKEYYGKLEIEASKIMGG
jgi:RecJ-like exonuclease